MEGGEKEKKGDSIRQGRKNVTHCVDEECAAYEATHIYLETPVIKPGAQAVQSTYFEYVAATSQHHLDDHQRHCTNLSAIKESG